MKNCFECKHYDVDIDVGGGCPTCGPTTEVSVNCNQHVFRSEDISRHDLVNELRKLGNRYGPTCDKFEVSHD